LLNVKPGGTQSNHWTLEGSEFPRNNNHSAHVMRL